MKKLLLGISFTLGFLSSSQAQCSVEVNDSLLSTYDYVLNAVNITGAGPFVFSWTVTDGNGSSVPFTTHPGGDSITIDATTLQNNYGCVIYQLCMTDMLGCTTCSSDTAMLQVPFPCFSQFVSNLNGPNQVSVQLISTMPPFLIASQYVTWTDGNGQSQYQPYLAPATNIVYTPGPANPSNKFFCCILTNLVTGGNFGCISCDSVQYTNSTTGIGELNKQQLCIAPNPASFKTQVESPFPIEAIRLVNSIGQVIDLNYSIEDNKAWLTVSELPKGIYMVEVFTGSGTFKERLIRD
ncbi:T9SS type A sorting domain-containing protein [Fluviicola sp.]|uniref:T9SS type A sorting domain-containing protein n=1 Tax=Fluviicola sp. TaxID=1917219 RepID=UPI00262EAF11|nr:T9SS type A sorting domain-containing protein [Fluviicola sp.]